MCRSIIGLGALMLVACLAGPAIAGAFGALGVAILVGAGGAIALCAAVPALAVAARRRLRRATVELADLGDR